MDTKEEAIEQLVREGELMAPHDRRAWIIRWFTRQSARHAPGCYSSGTTDREFSDAYLLATGASYKPTTFGAEVCSTLTRDLKALYDAGELKRVAMGIGDGLPGMGFPKWTWAYRL